MAHSSYLLEITSSEHPTVPLDFCFSDCFSINLICIIDFIQLIQPTNPAADIYSSSSSTTFNESFLVPSDILCNCNTEILHQIFSLVPVSSELLDEILPRLAENARTILSRERCGSLEMDVNLHVLTHIDDDDEDFEVYNDDDDHHQNVSDELGQLVNLLERPNKVDGVDEQCAICLEELFGDGNEDSSGGEVVRTNCSHVFHERCIFRWLERCIKCESPYSCPLCRCNMFPRR